MIDELQEIDRLCLIYFSNICHRLNPLIPMSKHNKLKLKEMISRIHPTGGTNIALGMNCAFDIIK